MYQLRAIVYPACLWASPEYATPCCRRSTSLRELTAPLTRAKTFVSYDDGLLLDGLDGREEREPPPGARGSQAVNRALSRAEK